MVVARKSSRYGHRDATMILIGYRHSLRAQIELATGRLHVRRAKNGSPSVHPMRGDEMRALRRTSTRQPMCCYEAANVLAHPCSKVVGAQSLGRQSCEAKRATQSQGGRRPKACRHLAPDVDRRYRVQVVIKGGCSPTCIAEPPNTRTPAGTNVPAGTLALVRSLLALRCSREQKTRFTH